MQLKNDKGDQMNEQLSGQDQCVASREKYWKELSIEEKQERLREVVKTQEHKIKELNELLFAISVQFNAHIHVDGKLFMPINTRTDMMGLITNRSHSNKDEVYF